MAKKTTTSANKKTNKKTTKKSAKKTVGKTAKKTVTKKAARRPAKPAAGKRALTDKERWGTRADLGADPAGCFEAMPEDLRTIALRLDKRLTKSGLSCQIKWGMPVYSLGKAMIANIFKGKGYIRLGLYTGAGLPDPAGLFEGEGKEHRHIKLYPNNMPAKKDLEALIDASLASARADHA